MSPAREPGENITRSGEIIAATVIVPCFTVDLCGVRIDGDDYDTRDLAAVVGQPRVHAAAVLLHRLAPVPTLAYVTGPGEARALGAHLRIAGLRARHVDDGESLDQLRYAVSELVAGHLDVLTSVRRLAGSHPIPGLGAAMLLRPTMRAETHFRQLGRLQPSPAGNVVIFDMVQACDRHGLPVDWERTTIEGPSCDVVRDPYLDRLADVPHRSAMTWAGKSIERLELVQLAKNFKPGWVYNAVKSFDPDAADRWWARQRPQRRA